jgi:hypothetical protein
MFDMFFLIFGIDQNIVDEDQYEFGKLLHGYRVHEIHEVSGGIGETKGYYQILEDTIMGGESSFRNFRRSNFDLVITRLKIDLREKLGSSQLIKENINAG